MAYSPIQNEEIQNGAPVDQSLLQKIKDNFDAQEAELAEQRKPNVFFDQVNKTRTHHSGTSVLWNIPFSLTESTDIDFDFEISLGRVGATAYGYLRYLIDGQEFYRTTRIHCGAAGGYVYYHKEVGSRNLGTLSAGGHNIQIILVMQSGSMSFNPSNIDTAGWEQAESHVVVKRAKK